ncbi:hypothetical protein BH10BDE1_BH10BDE1_31990 [soil metagenome]
MSQAKSGSQVLLVNGLATASLVNPEREGELWGESQTTTLKMTGLREPVVVIGVGSGFHLAALRSKLRAAGHTGAIAAIDTCEASIEFAMSRVPGIDYVHAQCDCGADQFVARSDISSWVLQPFTLLRHKPTYLRNGASLRQIESWLLGRTPEAFSAQLKLRPQIAAGLNADRARKIAECSLVSIRDLSKAWDISSELKTDRRLFRILEELVR